MPTEISPGIVLAFRVAIPCNHLNFLATPARLAQKVIWIESTLSSEVIEIAFLLSNHSREINNWPGKKSMGTELLIKHQLANGDYLWVIFRREKYSTEWYEWLKLIQSKFINELLHIRKLKDLVFPRSSRIMIGGFHTDGSRYYLDLNARKILTPTVKFKVVMLKIISYIPIFRERV